MRESEFDTFQISFKCSSKCRDIQSEFETFLWHINDFYGTDMSVDMKSLMCHRNVSNSNSMSRHLDEHLNDIWMNKKNKSAFYHTVWIYTQYLGSKLNTKKIYRKIELEPPKWKNLSFDTNQFFLFSFWAVRWFHLHISHMANTVTG